MANLRQPIVSIGNALAVADTRQCGA